MEQGAEGEQAEPRMSGLGLRIRELRTQRGWSLRKLATQAGLSHTHVAQIESGAVADPSVGKVMGIARALGVTVGSLLGEVTPEEPSPADPDRPLWDRLQDDLQAIQRLDPGGLEVAASLTTALRARAEGAAKSGRARKAKT